MPEVAIRAEALVKRYPLHGSPRAQLLDVLGLRFAANGERPETAAIDSVSFEVPRGEKLGVIGRNGSGKSTLLGLISGVIRPTSGVLIVTGQVHPLLSLGAGFSEEMSGAENVRSYLAQLGASGATLRRRVDEVEAFAELGEYFDQPMRTYSSGMRMRLTFAAATCIEPDVLLLDEVLSVGDAYFISKSLERMRALCSGSGTTLVLVSHSVGLVAELCDRVIWLERGRIRMDGQPEDVHGAYQQFMRAEEENRLQKLNAASAARRSRRAVPSSTPASAPRSPAPPPAIPLPGALTGLIQTMDRQPPAPGLTIAGLAFERDGAVLTSLPLEDGAAGPIVIREGCEHGNWGRPQRGANGVTREYLCYGSPFHTLPFTVRDSALACDMFANGGDAVLRCGSLEDLILEMRLLGGKGTDLAAIFPVRAQPGLQLVRSPLTPQPTEPTPEAGAVPLHRFGTRRMEITGVTFLDAGGMERLVFSTGSRFAARLEYRINDPSFDERATVVMVFEKDGYLKTHRFFLNQKRFTAARRREGEILLVADPLLLAPGEYAVTVAVHREGHATRRAPREHYTVSHDVYDMYRRRFQITVFETWHTTLLEDLVFQHPACWSIDGEPFDFRPVTD